MKRIEVEIWSDIACPWCWVGKKRFETALAAFSHRDHVSVRFRSFELDRSAPPVQASELSYAERLARKYGNSVTEAQAMIDRMTAVGAAEGITFRFDRVVAGNTFDAHRLLHEAAAHGRQDAMKERLLRAYFSEGEVLAEPEVLVGLAAEVGLDAEATRSMLARGAQAEAVRADEAMAAALGIHGVPFFVVDRRLGISGAQPAEALTEVLTRAWQDGPVAHSSEAAACGPDGCV